MRVKGVLFFIAVILLTLVTAIPTVWANADRAKDSVAPYAYFDVAVGSATGPFTTHYLVTNVTSSLITVNIKCYDSNSTRVGPAAGTNMGIAAHGIGYADPVSLQLTTSPAFDGYGWCYFSSSNYFTVGFVAGISVGNNLITTNNSRVIMSGTAQHMVTTNLSGVPYWTKEGSWDTTILALNPTTTSGTLTVDAYNPSGGLLGTWTTTLSARDMDFGTIASLVGVPAYTSWGNADIAISNRGFVGWVAGVNYNSFQAFIVPIPLSESWVSELDVGDRP